MCSGAYKDRYHYSATDMLELGQRAGALMYSDSPFQAGKFVALKSGNVITSDKISFDYVESGDSATFSWEVDNCIIVDKVEYLVISPDGTVVRKDITDDLSGSSYTFGKSEVSDKRVYIFVYGTMHTFSLTALSSSFCVVFEDGEDYLRMISTGEIPAAIGEAVRFKVFNISSTACSYLGSVTCSTNGEKRTLTPDVDGVYSFVVSEDDKLEVRSTNLSSVLPDAYNANDMWHGTKIVLYKDVIFSKLSQNFNVVFKVNGTLRQTVTTAKMVVKVSVGDTVTFKVFNKNGDNVSYLDQVTLNGQKLTADADGVFTFTASATNKLSVAGSGKMTAVLPDMYQSSTPWTGVPLAVESNNEPSSGCGSVAFGDSLLLSLLALAGFTVAVKKKKEN